ncbi:zinc ribbon domain-containing protein [Myxococcus sp. RHSTA-1-4]|uniref:zinc ribbon domain-containing protein n=1 Tax=Myxococcus sp. RHSTA-1-4 TaxID=2874601 RepID=UPI001CBE7E6A|nr:zinc ribbon domain-containing protein [Myxococcus sp. RHSTA-1-4]MBZ4418072.1 zinc ribbon domain-containing protein [Myxococcus sp. RHSTA-1-4]
MLCSHCGQPLPPGHGATCPHCGRNVHSTSSPVEDAADTARRTAEAAGRAVQSLLEDPRLRERLPGGSLPLLGSGLVATAVLLPVLPFFGGTIGLPWSLVMLAGSVLLGAREWRAAGRPLPPPLERVAQVAAHPAFLPLFTGLTLTFAFLSLSLGLVPLLWLAAAVVLGYVQWRVFQASPASAPELRPAPGATRFKRFVLAGTAVCAVSLLFNWGSGVGSWYSLGGYGYEVNRVTEVDRSGRPTGASWDEWNYGWRPGFSTTHYAYGTSGRSRTGAPLAVMSLLALALVGALPRVRAAVPPLLPPVLAGLLTLWGVTGLSSRLGPWLFLLGVVAIDVAVAREFLQPRGTGTPGPGPGPASP